MSQTQHQQQSDVSQHSEDPHDSSSSSSGSDTEEGSDGSEELFPQRNTKSSPGRPARELAREIEFSELLRWVRDHTAFELGDPALSKRPRSVRMQSQDELLPAEPSFVALSCSPAIMDFAARRTEESAQAPNAGQVGYMAPVPKSSMKPYQLTSMDVSPTAASHPDPKPDWMPHVSPRSRAYVRDMGPGVAGDSGERKPGHPELFGRVSGGHSFGHER